MTIHATHDDDVQHRTAAVYLALADCVESLTDQQWEAPSLCEGWSIRDVVAHVTMPARYSEAEFMNELKGFEFDFTRLSNAIAARDGQLPTPRLTADLRCEILHHWTPPGGDQRGALNHAVIHALDIAAPLNQTHVINDDTITIVLDDLTAGETYAHFGTVIKGRRIEANDINWSYGSGTELRGPARELALNLCGRTIPNGHLEGTPVSRG